MRNPTRFLRDESTEMRDPSHPAVIAGPFATTLWEPSDPKFLIEYPSIREENEKGKWNIRYVTFCFLRWHSVHAAGRMAFAVRLVRFSILGCYHGWKRSGKTNIRDHIPKKNKFMYKWDDVEEGNDSTLRAARDRILSRDVTEKQLRMISISGFLDCEW